MDQTDENAAGAGLGVLSLFSTARQVAKRTRDDMERAGGGSGGGGDDKDDGENCVRLRPQDGAQRLSKVSSRLVGETVSPFLRDHIPAAYASGSGGTEPAALAAQGNPNSRYCYRHRPDSKYRRAADERKMAKIQSELSVLPQVDQQAITTVWSLFSAAPSTHRHLMLNGIVAQSCFSQLSTMATLVSEQLKIDFLTALPRELAIIILRHLDTASLCKTAQVSRLWRDLSEDDQVWKHMCRQHIDKKCHKCGWGLPLLERRRLEHAEDEALARRLQQPTAPIDIGSLSPPRLPPDPLTPKYATELDQPAKRQCLGQIGSDSGTGPTLTAASQLELRTMPWKSVYRDRYMVGSNWKKGRCSVKVLKGHTNGITCLQLDETNRVLITGSYDATIKVWDTETAQEVRTLRGHTRGIRALCIDKSKLFSGALDGSIRLWNWRTGEALSTIGHSSGVISVDFKRDVLVSGSIDGNIRIWTFPKDGEKQTFCVRGHTDWVNQVRLDMSSRTILSSSDDGTVRLWDLDTRECLRTFRGHVGHVQQVLALPAKFEHDPDPRHPGEYHLDFQPPSPTAFDLDPSVETQEQQQLLQQQQQQLQQLQQQQQQPHYKTPLQQPPNTCSDTRSLYGTAFTKDRTRELPARHILTGSLDNTVRLWDTSTGACLNTWFGHVEGIWGLDGDNLRVVTCSQDSMLKVWEPGSGRCVRTFTGHAGSVSCVGLGDTLMASGGEDGDVRLYCFSATAGRCS